VRSILSRHLTSNLAQLHPTQPSSQFERVTNHPDQPPKVVVPAAILRHSRMCTNWERMGRCVNGSTCEFAHDKQQMLEKRRALHRYVAQVG
jgi:hypothetical protein